MSVQLARLFAYSSPIVQFYDDFRESHALRFVKCGAKTEARTVSADRQVQGWI